jgi:hypothetical protein
MSHFDLILSHFDLILSHFDLSKRPLDDDVDRHDNLLVLVKNCWWDSSMHPVTGTLGWLTALPLRVGSNLEPHLGA